MSTSHITLRETFKILFRRKKAFFFSFALILSIVILGLLLRAKTFRSDAKLFVRIGRESVTLDPTVTTGQTLSLRASRETEINSVVELLKGRNIIEAAVERIGVDILLAANEAPSIRNYISKTIGDGKKALMSLFASGEGAKRDPDAVRREVAIEKVADSISISAPEMTTVISVSGQAESPELAQNIVSAVLDAYTAEHVKLNRTDGSEQFFSHQASRLESMLADARKELRDFKNEAGIGSIDAHFKSLENQKAEIEATRMRNSTQLYALNAKRKSSHKLIETVEPFINTGRIEGLADAAGDGMRQQLYDLEIREKELAAKYNENHPMVKSIRKQVAEVRSILGDQKNSNSQSTYAINPVWKQLKLDLISQEAEIASLHAAKELLQQQLADVTLDLQRFNTKALRHDELSNNIARLEENYRTHSASLEQARINAAMEEMQITNVKIAQEAILHPKPIGPGNILLGGIGLIVAVIGGLVIAFFKDHMDRSLRLPKEVERELNLPVLMSIPRSAENRVHV